MSSGGGGFVAQHPDCVLVVDQVIAEQTGSVVPPDEWIGEPCVIIGPFCGCHIGTRGKGNVA